MLPPIARVKTSWWKRFCEWLRPAPPLITRYCVRCHGRLERTEMGCVFCAIRAADVDRCVHDAAMRRILLGVGSAADAGITFHVVNETPYAGVRPSEPWPRAQRPVELPVPGPGTPTSR